MALSNTVQGILDAALICEEKMCLNCKYSYFRPNSYDGYCKYVSNTTLINPMHLKHIGVYDVCEAWDKKDK